jgi:hypothetical protein
LHIWVETYTGHGGIEMPRRFFFDGRGVEVAENLDQWHGPSYRYFKVKGGDGNLYILRLDETRAEWNLTLFQSARAGRPIPEAQSRASAGAPRLKG